MNFSKNRELASLEQHGFLNEKPIDFLNAFFLRRGRIHCCIIFLNGNFFRREGELHSKYYENIFLFCSYLIFFT
jgi:hypothetical protein